MSKVTDFQSELDRRAAHIPRWHKIDLHNHSPASFDYQGDRSTAAEATAKVIIERDLSAVMFTDHERLPEQDFIDKVRGLTKRLIISGLELNVFVDAFDRPAEKVGKNLCFHLLVGFDPESRETPSTGYSTYFVSVRRSREILEERLSSVFVDRLNTLSNR